MVVFYSIPDGTLYYDYVDKIYFRLKDAHDDDSWELQESANIRIPVKNQLTPNSIKEIHGYMRQTFANFNAMYVEHAQAHGLPSIRKTVGPYPDEGIVAIAVRGLKDHGMGLLQSGDIMQLYQMVSVIPNGQLGADPILTIMAGMTYHEVGLYIDAEYYLTKGLYHQIEDSSLKKSAEWTKLKNDYHLNRFSQKEFRDRLKQMRDMLATSSPQNTVLLDLHIIRHAINGDSIHDPLPANIESSINDITARIDQLEDEPREKMFLQLMNAENLSLYLQRIADHHYLSLIQQYSQGKLVPIEASEKLAGKLNEKLSDLRLSVNSILQKAKDLNIPFIEAEAFAILSLTQLNLELSLLPVPDLHGVLSGLGHKAIINDHIRYLLEAYNRYIEHGYFDRAYHQICNALELIHIAEFHKFQVSFDKLRLEAIMTSLQEKLHAPSYIFQSLKLINNMNKRE